MTRLDSARVALHQALAETMAACGWAGRAEALPPRQIVPPMGWVETPTLAPGGAGQITATFPVAVVVDGTSKEQTAQLDALLAHGWQHLGAVERARVLTAGPQLLETGAGQTGAVVFSVQVTLLVRTLCGGAVTDSDNA